MKFYIPSFPQIYMYILTHFLCICVNFLLISSRNHFCHAVFCSLSNLTSNIIPHKKTVLPLRTRQSSYFIAHKLCNAYKSILDYLISNFICKANRNVHKLCSLHPLHQLCRNLPSSADGKFCPRKHCASKQEFSA